MYPCREDHGAKGEGMAKLIVVSEALHGAVYELRLGVNRLGRDAGNDFCLAHDSVSGVHCEVEWSGEVATVRDRGSAAGTAVNGDLVEEARLNAGRVLVLGEVTLRLSGGDGMENAGGETSATGEAAQGLVFGGQTVLCVSCGLQFDRDELKSIQAGGQTAWFCPDCGGRCQTAADWAAARESAKEKTFGAYVREAFGYPVNADGSALLAGGVLFFSAVRLAQAAAASVFYGIALSILLGVFVAGYLFSYLKSIVATSADGDEEMPDWPDLSDFKEDVLEPFFQLVALLVLCLGPGVVVMALAEDVAGWSVLACGLFYLPMGLLGVSIADSTTAGLNPALMVPSIIRVFGHYLVVLGMLAVFVGVRWACLRLENYLPFLVGIAVGELLSLYVLVVMMRVLGCLYHVNRRRLRWHGEH